MGAASAKEDLGQAISASVSFALATGVPLSESTESVRGEGPSAFFPPPLRPWSDEEEEGHRHLSPSSVGAGVSTGFSRAQHCCCCLRWVLSRSGLVVVGEVVASLRLLGAPESSFVGSVLQCAQPVL